MIQHNTQDGKIFARNVLSVSFMTNIMIKVQLVYELVNNIPKKAHFVSTNALALELRIIVRKF